MNEISIYTISFSKTDACKIYKNLLQEFRGNDEVEKRVVGELSVTKDKYLALIEKPISLDESEISHLESCYENISDNVIHKQIKNKAISIMKISMRNDLMNFILEMKKGYEDEIVNAASLSNKTNAAKLVKNRERRLRDINQYFYFIQRK